MVRTEVIDFSDVKITTDSVWQCPECQGWVRLGQNHKCHSFSVSLDIEEISLDERQVIALERIADALEKMVEGKK